MFSVALSSRLLVLAASASVAFAQGTTTTPPPSSATAAAPAQSTYPATPLANKRFTYDQLPYKVDTDIGLVRGNQLGFNICNSTTESQTSLCQTSIFNAIDDFCLWAPPEPGHNVGDIEGSMVAWCTKPGHGTRLIPAGALTGVQWTKTPDYVQAVGFIDQTKINIKAEDWGGEMDPHGADLRGNPMGGVLFSNAWTGSYVQAVEWHNFIGGNRFCLKACDPRGPNAPRFCEHILDRIGCDYNAPNNARDGIFESCAGDNQDFPGVYTENGEVKTYAQPAESLGAITTIPYVARIPASSSCVVHTSSAIYTGLPTAAGSSTASSTASRSGSASRAASSTSGVSGAASQTASSDATTLTISGFSLLGVVFTAFLLS